MTDEDRATLKGLIEMRLGNSALQMTRHRLTRMNPLTDHSVLHCRRMLNSVEMHMDE